MREKFSVLIVMALFLAACGSGGSNATTPPEAATLPELTQSTTSDDGVTVRYPDGWMPPITKIGIFVYNSKEAETGVTLLSMPKGSLYIQIGKQPFAGKTLSEVFDFAYSQMPQMLKLTLGEKQNTKVGSVDVFKAVGKGEKIALYAAVLPGDDESYLSYSVYVHPDELEAQTPLIEAILATVSYKKP